MSGEKCETCIHQDNLDAICPGCIGMNMWVAKPERNEFVDSAVIDFVASGVITDDKTVPAVSAHGLLQEARDIMDERGKQYDQPDGERSMAKTVAAFNIITGHKLSEADGWEFMKVLKQVRMFSVRNKSHPDSLKDEINYSALLAECALKNGSMT